MKTLSDLFDVYRDAVMADPSGSNSDASMRFCDAVKADPELVEVLAREYFTLKSRYWKPVKSKRGYTFTSHQNADKYQRSEADTVYEEMKTSFREVVFGDLILPNGKRLLDSKFADAARAGGFFAEIGRHGKPNQIIGRHLGERDFKNIYERFSQKAGKAATSKPAGKKPAPSDGPRSVWNRIKEFSQPA